MPERKEKKLSPKIEAFNQLENIRRKNSKDIVINYEKELAEARDERRKIYQSIVECIR